MEIKDMTNTNMLNLRRTIFLTIMSSVNFEECVHKVRRTPACLGHSRGAAQGGRPGWCLTRLCQTHAQRSAPSDVRSCSR